MLEVICVPQYISYFSTPFYSVNVPNWQTTHSITRHYAGLYLIIMFQFFKEHWYVLRGYRDSNPNHCRDRAAHFDQLCYSLMFCGTDGSWTRSELRDRQTSYPFDLSSIIHIVCLVEWANLYVRQCDLQLHKGVLPNTNYSINGWIIKNHAVAQDCNRPLSWGDITVNTLHLNVGSSHTTLGSSFRHTYYFYYNIYVLNSGVIFAW